MGQMAYVGPMLGQHHQFHHYNPGKSEFGERRYFKISERIYKELDERLSVSKFLAGEDYTIADIATYPWTMTPERQGVELKDYPNVKRWKEAMSKRPAVKKGMIVGQEMKRNIKLTEEEFSNLFGKNQYKHR